MSVCTGNKFCQAVIDGLGIPKREDVKVFHVKIVTEHDSMPYIEVRFAICPGLMTKIDEFLCANSAK